MPKSVAVRVSRDLFCGLGGLAHLKSIGQASRLESQAAVDVAILFGSKICGVGEQAGTQAATLRQNFFSSGNLRFCSQGLQLGR